MARRTSKASREQTPKPRYRRDARRQRPRPGDPDPPTCPSGKTRYRSLTAAEQEIGLWSDRAHEGPVPIRAYVCDEVVTHHGVRLPGCGYWHLSSSEHWRKPD